MSTVRIQVRRGLATDWTSVNPVLAAGELGVETDSLQIKVGDGTSHWNTLGYATVTPGNLTDAINAAITGTVDVNFATISDLDTAISQEVTDRNSAIATAKSQAEGYTDTHIANLSSVYDAAGSAASAVTAAQSASNDYTDGKISTEVTNRNSAIATAVSTAEGYTDTKITALVNGAPAVLDTLKELSDALGGDKNFATTVANHISAVTDGGTLHNATFTGTLTLPDGSITGSEIADLSITGGKIVAGTISGSKISDNAIQQSQLQNGSVGTNQLINNSVTVDKLANNSVTADKVVSIPTSKVTGLDTALTDISTTYATTANIVSTYAPISSPTFGGTVSLPSNTSIGTTTSTELGYVHGVTSAIQTQFGTAATNLSNHTSATTNVHGIADTSALATKSYVDTAVGTEATARSTALSTAEGYTDTAISTEVTNRNSAIATAKSQAISTSESYTDTSIATEVSNRTSAINTAVTHAVYTTDTGTVTSTMIADGTIATADIADSAITSAKIADGTIVNADINASAAIAYSKLNLASSITSSDIVDGTIVNADINASAAIAATKISGTAVTQADTGTVTSAMIADGTIVNGDISASAAIADSKLATISTSGKVSNSATTATDANTASAIVARDASGNFTANLITINQTPTAAGHAVSKSYVDNVAAGMNWHNEVKAATTGTLSSNYNNGTSGVGATLTADTNRAFTAIDGVTPWSLGDRILVKDQTAGTQNGIYTLTTIGSSSAAWVLTRASDADNSVPGQVTAGDAVYVKSGTANANQAFIQTTDGTGTNSAIVIGTDSIVWTQFTGAANLTAGNGLTRTGNSVDVVSSTLTVSADSVDLSTVSRSNSTGSATNNHVSSITTDTYGRVTAVATSPVNVATSSQQGVATFNTASFTVTGGDVTIKSGGVSNAQLANSTISGVSLGSNLGTLTIGTGLSGTSYNGSTGVTIAIDSTVATLTGSQTLTNKTLTTPVLNGPSVNSAGITFSDGTVQTTTGVASITTIATPATTTSSFSATTYRDQFVPITGGNTYTITDAGCPIGLSVNFWQNAGTLGVIAVAGSGSAAGATIVGTPGLKLRATNSVATAMKVSATTWILYGDLSA
jgi:hypothetical protein